MERILISDERLERLLEVLCDLEWPDAFDDDGPVDPFRGYSGRGMYGARCLGISCVDAGETALFLGRAVGRLEGDDDSWWHDFAWQCTAGGVKVDSLGRGQVLYLPGVQRVEDADDA